MKSARLHVTIFLLKKSVNIIAEASYQSAIIKLTDDKGSKNVFSFNAGPVVFLNKKTGLEFTLGYRLIKEETEFYYKRKQSPFQAGIGFQIYF